jgi:hypothetical protein
MVNVFHHIIRRSIYAQLYARFSFSIMPEIEKDYATQD